MHMHKENKAFLGPSRCFFFGIIINITIKQHKINSVNVLNLIIDIFLQIMIMKTYKTSKVCANLP